MLRRLPYRMQIPLGLVLAVTLAVVLVNLVAAQIAARNARQDIISTAHRVVALLTTQGRALLAQDDTWRAFTLLKSATALMPEVAQPHARAALLDAQGHYLAGSDPLLLPTGAQALGTMLGGRLLPTVSDASRARVLDSPGGGVTLIEPVRSDDDQILGFVLADIDAPAFKPNWAALATPALIGAALATLLLAPLGWLIGRRMARPIAQTAQCIGLIGHTELGELQQRLPQVDDPELRQIVGSVQQLLTEMEIRQANEKRALSAERLAAIGRITAAVAHEINNPLAGLITAVHTLRLHGDAPEQRQRSLDLIERGLEQIRTMTTALLPQAKVEDRCMSERDHDDVLTLAQVTAAKYCVALGSQLQLLNAFCVPSVVMRQVMLNLLLNAIKAAGEGGEVRARLRSDADAVSFSVMNTGAHLSAQELHDRLHAQDRNDPHGFGLWICHEFAVRFGGNFNAMPPSDLPPPFATGLIFSIPNQPRQATPT